MSSSRCRWVTTNGEIVPSRPFGSHFYWYERIDRVHFANSGCAPMRPCTFRGSIIGPFHSTRATFSLARGRIFIGLATCCCKIPPACAGVDAGDRGQAENFFALAWNCPFLFPTYHRMEPISSDATQKRSRTDRCASQARRITEKPRGSL